jgi:hypothetical protein
MDFHDICCGRHDIWCLLEILLINFLYLEKLMWRKPKSRGETIMTPLRVIVWACVMTSWPMAFTGQFLDEIEKRVHRMLGKERPWNLHVLQRQRHYSFVLLNVRAAQSYILSRDGR